MTIEEAAIEAFVAGREYSAACMKRPPDPAVWGRAQAKMQAANRVRDDLIRARLPGLSSVGDVR